MTVLTRTVAFCAKGLTRRKEQIEDFEERLQKWLCKKYPCTKESDETCYIYLPKTNHLCIDYLKELGGVTHYVSSLTLGATRYQVTIPLYFKFFWNWCGFICLSIKATRKVFQSISKEQQIDHDSRNSFNFERRVKQWFDAAIILWPIWWPILNYGSSWKWEYKNTLTHKRMELVSLIL